MSDPVMSQCKMCGHIGRPVKEFEITKLRAIIFFVILFVLLLVQPIISLIIGTAGAVTYLLTRTCNCCKQCGSLDLEEYKTPQKKIEIARKRDFIESETARKKDFIESMNKDGDNKPLPIEVLGGHGWEQHKGEKIFLTKNNNHLFFHNTKTFCKHTVPILDITNIEIGGPGKTSTSAGVSGGGFGFEGALTGMAIATAINLIASRTDIRTIVRLEFNKTELLFLSKNIEPSEMRTLLSFVFVSVNQAKHISPNTGFSVSEELARLHELKESGAIDEAEFNMAKKKILS